MKQENFSLFSVYCNVTFFVIINVVVIHLFVELRNAKIIMKFWV